MVGAVLRHLGVGLLIAAGLLAAVAGRAGDDVAAVGFAAVALYGVGTTHAVTLFAAGELSSPGPTPWKVEPVR